MSKIYNRHHPQSFGLTNAWPLDERVGVDVFDIVDAASGTFSGSPSRIVHPKGYALRTTFGNFAVCGNVPALSGVTQFTMSAFIRRNATNGMGVFLGQGTTSGARVILQPWNDGQIYFSMGASIYGTLSNNDTNWHHVAFVYDGSQSTNALRLICYYDGIKTALSYSGTIPSTSGSTTDNFRIGRDQVNSQEGAGDVYDIRVYNKILPENRIREIAFKPQELFVQPKKFVFAPVASGISTLNSNGTSASSFTSSALKSGALSSTGSGAASFTSSALKAGTLSSSGTSVATFNSPAPGQSTFVSTATSTVSFVSSSIDSATLNSTAISTASFSSSSLKAGALNSTGSGATSFVSSSLKQAALNSAGQGQANLSGGILFKSTFTSFGTSQFNGVGSSTNTAGAFNIQGTSSVDFQTPFVFTLQPLPRLPIDPYYPIGNDINALRVRMYDVYRQIMIHSNKLAEEIDRINGF